MDTKVKNMFGTETIEDRAEQPAPRPIKTISRSAHLYDILSSLGGSATLAEIWRMVPASDLHPKPKNKQQLRDWLSQSSTSKGYSVRTKKDHYRLATFEEHRTIVGRNRETARKFTAKKKRQEARAAAKAATLNLAMEQPVVKQPVVEQPVVKQPVVKQPVVEQPVVKQPVVEQPNTSSQFAREYLGALLGTSCAIVLFYVILKLTV